MPELSGECMVYYMTNGTCCSPVLVDVDGDGFALTDAAHGVLFDLDGNRFRYRAKVKDRRDAQLGRWAWDVSGALLRGVLRPRLG